MPSKEVLTTIPPELPIGTSGNSKAGNALPRRAYLHRAQVGQGFST